MRLFSVGAALERGRAVFVLNHCHFCHGEDLTRANMGAANLTQSSLVGADTDGNAIGAVVRAGLPDLQTAMPSYRELSSQEMVDLARYIHYLRQQAKYNELIRPATPAGGEPYVEKHSSPARAPAPRATRPATRLPGLPVSTTRPRCARAYSALVRRNPWRASSRRQDNRHP